MVDALLDTTITIDLLRGYAPAEAWLNNLRPAQLALTPVVWMETVRGAMNARQRAQMVRFLRQFAMEHPTPDDNRWAMRQFSHFYLSHHIDFPDVMIASVAARLGVPIYTMNLRHCRPLPGVQAVQPY